MNHDIVRSSLLSCVRLFSLHVSVRHREAQLLLVFGLFLLSVAYRMRRVSTNAGCSHERIIFFQRLMWRSLFS